jgi:hypothetical protein
VDLTTVKRYAAGGELQQAGNEIDDRGLAGAVRADQPGDAARPRDHGKILHGKYAAETA